MDIEIRRMVFLSKNKKMVLRALCKEPKIMPELIKETGIIIQNLSRTLRELKKNGLVEQQNPKVRKGKIFTLTEKGRRCIKEMIKSGLLL